MHFLAYMTVVLAMDLRFKSNIYIFMEREMKDH